MKKLFFDATHFEQPRDQAAFARAREIKVAKGKAPSAAAVGPKLQTAKRIEERTS